MLSRARDVVAENVAPLELSGHGRGGHWSFRLQHSTRILVVEFAGVEGGDTFTQGNAPREIIGFGHIELTDEAIDGMVIGANIAAFVREDGPWVIHYQEVQLRNMALMSDRMRSYEPFFLNDLELDRHAPFLWGGTMHVFTPSHRELNVEVLVEWFAQLMPPT
jgi:hypothetical protein